MATTYNFAAPIDEIPALHFKNTWTADEATDALDGKLWNTGMATANQAYAVDDCGLVVGKSYVQTTVGGTYEGELTEGDDTETVTKWTFDNSGLVDGEVGPAFTKKHIASIRLYKNNEYVYLAPGDEIYFNAKSYQELVYYVSIPDSDILTLVNRADILAGAPVISG